MVGSHWKAEDTNMPIGTDSEDQVSEVYIGNSTRGHSCYIVKKDDLYFVDALKLNERPTLNLTENFKAIEHLIYFICTLGCC